MASQLSLEKKINVVTVLDDILALKEMTHEIVLFLQNIIKLKYSRKMHLFFIFVAIIESVKNTSNSFPFEFQSTKKYVEKPEGLLKTIIILKSSAK